MIVFLDANVVIYLIELPPSGGYKPLPGFKRCVMRAILSP